MGRADDGPMGSQPAAMQEERAVRVADCEAEEVQATRSPAEQMAERSAPVQSRSSEKLPVCLSEQEPLQVEARVVEMRTAMVTQLRVQAADIETLQSNEAYEREIEMEKRLRLRLSGLDEAM